MSGSLSPKDRITSGQNRTVWVLLGHIAKASGIDKDELKLHAVRAVSGQDHLSQLTSAQAVQVIDRLRRDEERYTRPPPREPWGPRGEGPRDAATLTPDQQATVQALFRQAGMAATAQQRGFCQKLCKKPWPQTKADADKLFHALSAMVMRKNPPASLVARVQALELHVDRLTDWERGTLRDYRCQLDEGGLLSPHKIAKIDEMEGRVGARSEGAA